MKGPLLSLLDSTAARGCAPLLLAALVGVSTGCHKKTPAAPPRSASEQAQPASTENPQPLVGEVDPAMTRQLQVFIEKNGRLPADFQEFARTSLDMVPRTGSDKKWAIDAATREVKLVNR